MLRIKRIGLRSYYYHSTHPTWENALKLAKYHKKKRRKYYILIEKINNQKYYKLYITNFIKK